MIAALVAALAVLLGLAVLTAVAPASRAGRDSGLDMALAAAAATSLVVAALLCGLLWRHGGEAATLRIGGGLVLAAGSITMLDVLPALVDGHLELLAALAPVAALASLGAGAHAAVGPTVDSSLTPVRVLAELVAGTLVLLVACRLAGLELAPHTSPEGAGAIFSLILALLWLSVAAAFMLRARWRRSWTFTAYGLLALALSLHHGGRFLAQVSDQALVDGHAGIVTVAAVLMIVAALRDIHRSMSAQSAHMLTMEVLADSARSRAASRREGAEVRVHQARNALCAVMGATQTLERYHDRLPAATRANLVESVATEVAKLQVLVSLDLEVGDLPQSDPGAVTASQVGPPTVDAL